MKKLTKISEFKFKKFLRSMLIFYIFNFDIGFILLFVMF